jgi:class 3 adenylate cyclase
VAELGITVKVAIHAGEVERDEDEIIGITVHVCATLVTLPFPGEIIVSGIVKNLVAGSGIEFTERGTYTLKGLPGEWQIFSPRVPDSEEAPVQPA